MPRGRSASETWVSESQCPAETGGSQQEITILDHQHAKGGSRGLSSQAHVIVMLRTRENQSHTPVVAGQRPTLTPGTPGGTGALTATGQVPNSAMVLRYIICNQG